MNKNGTKILSQIVRICKAIDREYDKLSIEKNSLVFDRYHDDMLYQSEGAWNECNEIEHSLNEGKLTQEEVDLWIILFKDTLAFCKSVIKTQNESVKITSPVFGY
tara:strand:+ start:187 stop:501 length:315 start_codon:yes stop_codon:yes gene_type:complete